VSKFFSVRQALKPVPRGVVGPPLSLDTFITKMDKALSEYNFRPVSTSVENFSGNPD